MKFDEENIKKLKEILEKKDNFLIMGHKKPDGDSIGSVLGLSLALRGKGKKVTSCTIDPITDPYLYLPKTYLIRQEIGSLDKFDVVIILDCGDRKMTGYHKDFPDLFSNKREVINIDHHISNDSFGTLNIVNSEASSTTHIIYYLLKKLGLTITSEIATHLLTGIYYDTGSFKHDNTTGDVLGVAADLSRLGAKGDLIGRKLFNNYTIDTLHLWGKIFQNLKQNKKGIVSGFVRDIDFEECNLKAENVNFSQLMNYVDGVPNTKFSVLLAENNGTIRGSFRTSDKHVDVSKIAGLFNGGGHKKAAGFVMKGKIQDVEGKLNVQE